MKIYDAFTFFNEIDVLKMRLELLYDSVDHFYISEADHTHSGKPKPFYFEERIGEFAKWADKIEYLKVSFKINNLDFSKRDEVYTPSSASWQLEQSQRNALAQFINIMDDNDIALISDLDEFVDPDILENIKKNGMKEGARLELKNHCLYMNCRVVNGVNIWRHPYVASGRLLRKHPDLSRIRLHGSFSESVENAGWHFSYLGGPQQISKKLKAFAHTEYSSDEYASVDVLSAKIAAGHGMAGPTADLEYAFVPLRWYPPHIRKIMEKNPSYIYTDLST